MPTSLRPRAPAALARPKWRGPVPALRLKDVPPSDPGGGPGAGGPAAASETADSSEVRRSPPRPLRCAACKAEITHEAHRIAVDGSHEHTRLNPVAYAFHFGCFSAAEGCEVVGVPSTEHSWFTGCAWQYAVCRACGAHLGWYFSGAHAFFGLILERLVTDGDA